MSISIPANRRNLLSADMESFMEAVFELLDNIKALSQEALA